MGRQRNADKVSQAYVDARAAKAKERRERRTDAVDVWRSAIKRMSEDVQLTITGKLGFFFKDSQPLMPLGRATLMVVRPVAGSSKYHKHLAELRVVGLVPKYEKHEGGGSIVYETKLSHDLLLPPYGVDKGSLNIDKAAGGNGNGGHLEWLEFALSVVSKMTLKRDVEPLRQLPPLPQVFVATKEPPAVPEGVESWGSDIIDPTENGNTSGLWLTPYASYTSTLPQGCVLYENYTDFMSFESASPEPIIDVIQDTGRTSFESQLYTDGQLLDISGSRFVDPVTPKPAKATALEKHMTVRI